jgi:hypothetical protein
MKKLTDQGAFLFWFHLVLLKLPSTFVYVGGIQISCGLLPTHFTSIF